MSHQNKHLVHRGVLGMDAGIMILFAMLGVASMVSMQMFMIDEILPDLHNTINRVPTFYTYDEDGKRVTGEDPIEEEKRQTRYSDTKDKINSLRVDLKKLEGELIEAQRVDDTDEYDRISEEIKLKEAKLKELGYDFVEKPNLYLKLYWMYGDAAKYVFVGLVGLSGVLFLFEKSKTLVKEGTAKKLFKMSIIALVVIHVVPEVWDPFASILERAGLFMLDPFDGKPENTINRLWNEMGFTKLNSDNVLNDELLESGLNNPVGMGQEFFMKYILGFFKLSMTTMMTLSFFVSSVVRYNFVLIVMISLPLWLVFLQLPVLKKVSKQVLSSFVGVLAAPIIVSTVLFVGSIRVSVGGGDAIEEFLTVMSIAMLAQMIIPMMAPFIGSTISGMNTMMQRGMTQATIIASSAGSAAGKGGISAMQDGQGIGGIASAMGGAGFGAAMSSASGAAVPSGGKSSGSAKKDDDTGGDGIKDDDTPPSGAK